MGLTEMAHTVRKRRSRDLSHPHSTLRAHTSGELEMIPQCIPGTLSLKGLMMISLAEVQSSTESPQAQPGLSLLILAWPESMTNSKMKITT
jgi:hypothetical protein